MPIPVNNQAGESVRCAEIVQDLPEYKGMDMDRLELFQAVEQSPNMIAIIDASGAVEYVNPKFMEITGYSPGEILGKNMRVLLSPAITPEEYGSLWNTLCAGREWRGEFQNSTKDGRTFWEYQTISPLKNGRDQTTHFLATKEDVSQRKSLEEQLRHSQKLEAVGRLAGGVAHDFNNLLTVIIGYAEMAGSRLSSNDPLLADIQEVKKAGERASILVRQLLAFSRRQMLQPVMLDLNQSVRDLDQMFPRLLGEAITLKTNLSPEIAQVRADAGQMEQVIVNLAINSRDAMPKGGEFTIQTSNVDIGPDFAIDQLQVNPGSYVLLAITDTGLGMTPETMARLFEPFFTTKERGKGTGLGLSTVYGIVRQSGGGIHVQSEPGKGTTFYIYLPRARGAQIDPLPNIVDTHKPHGRIKVLVVEDEPTVRKFAVETLSRNGYDVFGTGNSEEALRFCADHDGRLDLLLTDIILPGMNGHDLANRIHERWPGMKVLYMSGYSETALDFNLAMDPGVEFIPKPFTPKGLLRKVQQVLYAASVPDAEVST